jgi:protein SCO1/2
LLGLVLVATAVGTLLWGGAKSTPVVPIEPPPILGEVPDFELINRDGSSVGLSDFAGRLWVADFIFTRCALSCPRMTSQMMRLAGSLPEAAEVALVSFTVDPENDSPEVLDSYATSLGIDQPDWFFLTGDRQQLELLTIDGFKLPIVRDPPEEVADPREPILHSERFVLVDGEGRIRGYYRPNEEGERERLHSDILSLTAGLPDGAGESSAGGEAMSAMTTNPGPDACAREIEALHEFFGQWFRAELPATETGFARFESALANDFSLIGPDGEEIGRTEILERVRSAHGSMRGQGFEIWIENIQSRQAPERHCLMTYQEWQRGKETRVRISTVLFRSRPSAPNGVEWLHLHETWLPVGAKGS